MLKCHEPYSFSVKQDKFQFATRNYILLSVCVCVITYEVCYPQVIECLVSKWKKVKIWKIGRK